MEEREKGHYHKSKEGDEEGQLTRLTIRNSLVCIIDTERLLAATFSARVAFGATIGAKPAQACRWVDAVNRFVLVIVHHPRSDATQNA